MKTNRVIHKKPFVRWRKDDTGSPMSQMALEANNWQAQIKFAEAVRAQDAEANRPLGVPKALIRPSEAILAGWAAACAPGLASNTKKILGDPAPGRSHLDGHRPIGVDNPEDWNKRHRGGRPYIKRGEPSSFAISRAETNALIRGGCKFPIGDVGDKDFHFCKAKRAPGSSYCSEHHALTHTVRPTPSWLTKPRTE